MLLSCICWVLLLKNLTTSIIEAMEHFYDIISPLIRQSVPMIKVKTFKYPQWDDLTVILLCKQKESVRQRFIRNGRDRQSDDYFELKKFRKEVKVQQKNQYES